MCDRREAGCSVVERLRTALGNLAVGETTCARAVGGRGDCETGAASLQLNKALEPLGLNQKVAVAIVPVGVKAAPIAIGDTSPAQVAWSTIKVPSPSPRSSNTAGPYPRPSRRSSIRTTTQRRRCRIRWGRVRRPLPP